jgi:glycosyltransferase involved in cell wall biosynthesis
MSPSLTAFFPAYNDSGTIASMVVVADMTCRQLTDDYEVIVVNDGSPDHCGAILAELQTRYPRLRVVTHEKNKGYGGAIRSGITNASKDLIFYTDGDAQYDPRELKLLYEALSDDLDMVNGYKISRNDPINRKIIGKIYHHIVRIAFNLHLRDVDCDFRLMRRPIFDVVKLESDSGVICVELMTKIERAGFKIGEVPVHHFHRAFGISQFFNFRRLFRTGIDLLRLWHRLVWRGEARPGSTHRSVTEPAPRAVQASAVVIPESQG